MFFHYGRRRGWRAHKPGLLRTWSTYSVTRLRRRRQWRGVSWQDVLASTSLVRAFQPRLADACQNRYCRVPNPGQCSQIRQAALAQYAPVLTSRSVRSGLMSPEGYKPPLSNSRPTTARRFCPVKRSWTPSSTGFATFSCRKTSASDNLWLQQKRLGSPLAIKWILVLLLLKIGQSLAFFFR